ncbi:MAG: DUF166 family protein [Bacillota bacterium]
MRILLVIQTDNGMRFVEAIKTYGPSDWVVEHYAFPAKLSLGVDDEWDDILPSDLPQYDLLLMLQEEPVVVEMAPDLAKMTGAKAIIAPIENKAHLPTGLARQVAKKLAKKGIEMLHPLVFCSLTENDSENPYIKEFAKYFGRPEVEITREKDKVGGVKVLRDSPCGNTRYVAQHLVGVPVKNAVEESGLMHHAHPCTTTMTMDPEIGDTLMHRAGLITKQAVEEALKGKK